MSDPLNRAEDAHAILDTDLCSLVDHYMKGVAYCAVRIKDLNVNHCLPNLQTTKCQPTENCVYQPDASFSIAGGYVSGFTCRPDKQLVATWYAGLAATVLGVFTLICYLLMRTFFTQYAFLTKLAAMQRLKLQAS